MDEFSHLGYAVWFGLIEIICKESGTDLSKKIVCSPTYLRRKLRTSQAKLREVLEYCLRDGRLLADFSGERWEFQIPKISEIKDNYTKDLQAAGKKPSKHKEKEGEKEGEKEVIVSLEKKKDKKKTSLPEGFKVSDRVVSWAEKKKYIRLEEHLENFKLQSLARGYKYMDWDSAFMTAIRDDWAKINDDKNIKPKGWL